MRFDHEAGGFGNEFAEAGFLDLGQITINFECKTCAAVALADAGENLLAPFIAANLAKNPGTDRLSLGEDRENLSAACNDPEMTGLSPGLAKRRRQVFALLFCLCELVFVQVFVVPTRHVLASFCVYRGPD